MLIALLPCPISAYAASPTITQHPESVALTHGGDTRAEFSVIATGTAPLSYQWQRASFWGGDLDREWINISGANTANYSHEVDVGGYALIRVVVSNSYGHVKSNVANFSLPPTVPINPYLFRNITQPTALTNVTEGSITGSLFVEASSPIGMTRYQWYSNTSHYNWGGMLIPGATSASFTIPTTLTASGSPYYFYCTMWVDIAGLYVPLPIPSHVATVIVSAVEDVTDDKPDSDMDVTDGKPDSDVDVTDGKPGSDVDVTDGKPGSDVDASDDKTNPDTGTPNSKPSNSSSGCTAAGGTFGMFAVFSAFWTVVHKTRRS